MTNETPGNLWPEAADLDRLASLEQAFFETAHDGHIEQYRQFFGRQNSNLSVLPNILTYAATNFQQRLGPAEEQGRNHSGTVNVLATLVLSRLHEATRRKFGNHSREVATIKTSEETYLEAFAREAGCWHNDATQGIGAYYDNGQEQVVYLDPNNTRVVTKLNNLNLNVHWLELLDRIALHNTYFPATAYLLQGFGRDENHNFVAILTQCFIQSVPVSQQEIVDYMLARGYELLSHYDETLIDTVAGYQSFVDTRNGILVEDLHLNNVRKDRYGNIFVIDPLISLNTPDKGYGGTRTIRGVVETDPNELPPYYPYNNAFHKASSEAAQREVKAMRQKPLTWEQMKAQVDRLRRKN